MEPFAVEQVTRGVGRIFRVRRNVAIHDRRLERSIRDHGEWMEERSRTLHGRLTEIDNDHESRGVFRSGMRLASRRDAKAEALRELRTHRGALTDLREDVLDEETILERIYRRVRNRPVPEVGVPSVEAEVEAAWRTPEIDPSGSPILQIPE